MTPEYIVIHHSLTEDNETLSWDNIRKYHIEHNGWSAVGYQFCVELVDNGYELLMGRMPNEVGAHATELGMNRRSIGICAIGNYDVDHPGEQMLAKLIRLIRWLMMEYEIPARNVIGHREVGLMAGFDWKQGQYKSCPGKLWDMDDLRFRLSRY
jgi:hypothetical protein